MLEQWCFNASDISMHNPRTEQGHNPTLLDIIEQATPIVFGKSHGMPPPVTYQELSCGDLQLSPTWGAVGVAST